MIANGQGDLVSGLDVELHLRPAQVDVAVLQPHLFVADDLFAGQKGRQLALVEQAHLGGHQLDLAGFDVGIAGRLVAQLQQPGDRHYVFAAQLLGALVQRRVRLVVEDHLRHARAVAQIDKDDAAKVSPPVNPSHQDYGLAGVGGAEFSAAMSAFQIT